MFRYSVRATLRLTPNRNVLPKAARYGPKKLNTLGNASGATLWGRLPILESRLSGHVLRLEKLMNDKSFHEKTGLSQADSGFCAKLSSLLISQACCHCCHPSIRTLRELFSSVHYECSQFSRCCHLIRVLISLPHREWARPSTQSPERGAWVLRDPDDSNETILSGGSRRCGPQAVA